MKRLLWLLTPQLKVMDTGTFAEWALVDALDWCEPRTRNPETTSASCSLSRRLLQRTGPGP